MNLADRKKRNRALTAKAEAIVAKLTDATKIAFHKHVQIDDCHPTVLFVNDVDADALADLVKHDVYEIKDGYYGEAHYTKGDLGTFAVGAIYRWNVKQFGR
jgi:hypothetical protein